MEKGRRENGVLAHVGLPHLEMIGGRQLFLEQHKGLLAYSDTAIDINTGTLVVRVRGTGLQLLAMTAEELRVGGTIEAVEFLR